MFPYQDPTGTGFLSRQGALDSYRSKLHKHYEKAAARPGTHFKTLEAFEQLKQGRSVDELTSPVVWPAFPIRRRGIPNDKIDRDRASFQEEYAEWDLQSAVARPSGRKIQTITFSTAFPEFFEALANVSFDALVAGLQDIFPGARPTSEELLGKFSPPPRLVPDGEVGPKTWGMLQGATGVAAPSSMPILRQGDFGSTVNELQRLLQRLNLLTVVDGDFGPGTKQAVINAQNKYIGAGPLFREHLTQNPWVNGKKGICCLLHHANTQPFLLGLLAHCCVPVPGQNPKARCAQKGSDGTLHCVPDRNSDPNVCEALQQLVNEGRFVTLKDPTRIRIFTMKGRWQLNGTAIDINDPNKNQGIWRVTRNGQQGVLKLLPGLKLDEAEIKTGAQVSKKLFVGVDVLVAGGANEGNVRSMSRGLY